MPYIGRDASSSWRATFFPDPIRTDHTPIAMAPHYSASPISRLRLSCKRPPTTVFPAPRFFPTLG